MEKITEDRIKKYRVITYDNGKISEELEDIIEEESFQLYLNSEKIFVINCSPYNLEEMAVGYLWMTGYIENKEDIDSIEIVEDIINVKANKILVDNSEKEPLKNYDTKLSYSNVPNQMKLLFSKTILFERTAGVHSAALIENDEILVYMEDIGRHNTLDKIAGYCLLNNIDMEGKIIAFSGRLPLEIVTKIHKMKIPIIVSKSCGTNKGIEYAKKNNITLCGFTRNKRYHIYTNDFRIVK